MQTLLPTLCYGQSSRALSSTTPPSWRQQHHRCTWIPASRGSSRRRMRRLAHPTSGTCTRCSRTTTPLLLTTSTGLCFVPFFFVNPAARSTACLSCTLPRGSSARVTLRTGTSTLGVRSAATPARCRYGTEPAPPRPSSADRARSRARGPAGTRVQVFQWALLNLVALHFRFGHMQLALEVTIPTIF